MESCFFIGHHDAGDEVLPLLSEAVERHITIYGVSTFFVGHYGNFDRMAAQAVKAAKEQHPEIRLLLVLPYHPAIRPIEKPDGFDCTYYPWENERIPKRLAVLKTNQRMVQDCSCLIAYVVHFLGGSGQLLECARKREKRGLLHIENLAEKCGSKGFKKYTAVLSIFVMAFVVVFAWAFSVLRRECSFWKMVATTPEPERCSLCGEGNGMRYYAPAIVNLSTGEVGELQVYDNHHEIVGELAPVQDTGVFCFGHCAGLAIVRSAGSHEYHVALPGEWNPLVPGLFCHDCRKILAETTNRGYVLLDLYDLENIQALAIADGAEYTIRDYTVSVYQREGLQGLSIEVTGHLFGAE